MRAHNKVIWCDSAWFPFYYGFCPNEKAWAAQMRNMKIKNAPYPTSVGACTQFIRDNGDLIVLVTIRDNVHKHFSKIGILGFLTHEATHVWQNMIDKMGEQGPSREFEAYAIQNISLELWRAFLNTRRIAPSKSTGALRARRANKHELLS